MSEDEYLNRNLSVRRYLVTRLASKKNIRIYAFDTFAFTDDLANYVNLQHYDGNISVELLNFIAEDTRRLTAENIADYEHRFENDVNHYQVFSGAAECDDGAL